MRGKVCVVTGGSRGIGKAIACKLSSEGAIVYATATKQDGFDNWLPDFNAGCDGEVRSLAFDVSDAEECRKAVLQIKRECGRVDVLVNNAAVEFNELIGMIDENNLHHMLDVNVCGPINLIQLVSRIMSRGGGGSIINIASLVGERGNAGQLVYSATKGAIIALTKSAAKELGPANIRVNAIAPGLTDTDMMRQADPERLSKRIANISLGRLAEPEDIANACAFLASDSASYISGQVLAVDGCTVI